MIFKDNQLIKSTIDGKKQWRNAFKVLEKMNS